MIAAARRLVVATRAVLVSPIGFLCLAAAIVAAGYPSAQGPQAGTRVLVFNVHAGKDAAGERNLEAVADLVRRVEADIVLLQEIDRGTRRSGHVDQLAELERLTRYSAAFGKSLDYDGGHYGIAALSRQPIASAATSALPVQPAQARAGGRYEPRAALTFSTGSPTGPLQVLNTHLDASRDEHYRLQESAHILTLVEGLTRGRLPVLAGGDFNAEPGSETYKQIIARGLRDAWQECGTGDGFTYPAHKPIKRIDYLFLRGPVRCTSASVIDTQVSDHRPLVVELAGIDP